MIFPTGTMVRKKTVENWGFQCLGYELDSEGEVSLIFCKTCREFYSSENEQRNLNAKHKSKKFADQNNVYIKGTSVVKKVNFEKHLKFEVHVTAALRLQEAEVVNQTSNDVSQKEPCCSTSTVPRQSLLRPLIHRMTAHQHSQLRMKFQLAHFVCSTGKSFKSYLQFAHFEKDYHGVDLGSGYLNGSSASEIMKYIATSTRIKNITEPLKCVRSNFATFG